MENIMIAVISAMATIMVAIIGLLGGKKFSSSRNLSSADQVKLVSTLKDTLTVQTERIKILEAAHVEQVAELASKDQEIKELRDRVSKLEQLTIEQALIISQLQQINKRRVRPRNEGGDLQTDENNRTD